MTKIRHDRKFRSCLFLLYGALLRVFLFVGVFLFAVFAAVDALLRIGQKEDLLQLLLNGSDAARVFTFYHVVDLFRKRKGFLFHDLVIFDNIDGDIVVDESQRIQVNFINRALDLNDIFFTHLITLCIFDDGNGTVEFVESQVFIDFHALAGFDMVQYETFVKSTDI